MESPDGVNILSISRVEKHFGGNYVLNGVDMEVEGRRIYQMMGPNGCGKTTLINVVSGLFGPDAGSITFDGKNVTRMDLYQTYGAGLVRTWQIPRPFGSLTTLENILVAGNSNSGESFLNAPSRRWVGDERDITDRALAIMDTVSLREKADTPSKNLSGGQRKLLELGRAMMSGAKMILMDEPIAGVNPALAIEIFERIVQICKHNGITFLIIEHRLDIAFQYVHHVFAMDEGRVIAEDTPENIINNPDVMESYIGK